MGEKNVADTGIETASAKADAVIDERNRLRESIARAKAELAETKTAIRQAQERLASGTGEARAQAEARKEFINLRATEDLLAAELGGLEQKLSGVEGQVEAVWSEFRRARNLWADAQVATFRQEYQEAVEQFCAVLRKGLAIAAACDSDPLFGVLTGIQFHDPTDWRRTVGNTAWRDDPKTKELYENLVPVMKKFAELDDLQRDVRERRHAEACRQQRLSPPPPAMVEA